MKRTARPPKCWAARTGTLPSISGIAHNGSPVVHPEVFREYVRLGIIDKHGRVLRRDAA